MLLELEQRQRELERLDEARRNRAQRMPERQPDFGNSWTQPPQGPFEEFPTGPPRYGHPPPGLFFKAKCFNLLLANAFEGPNGRPNPTFGHEPRFFGGGNEPGDEDFRGPPNQEGPPLGPEIGNFMQTFREEPPHHGGRPNMVCFLKNQSF